MELEDAWRLHREDLYRHAWRLSGSSAEADDLAQECFLRLREQLGERGAPRNVRAWLFRVLQNLHLDLTRRRRVRRTAELVDAEALPDPRPGPADTAEAGERARRARRVLESLSPRDRQLLMLRAAGLSYVEIAEVTGLRRSSLGRLLERATARAAARAREEGA